MLTALRAGLNEAMAALPAARKPALRRADSDDWLLCTDLPGLMEERLLTAFIAQLAEEGWTCGVIRGWLYFDHAVTVPEADVQAPLQGEAACVQSLLLRHPDDQQDAVAIRRLCKAQEQGMRKVEACCRALHAELAERLRCHQPLPSRLLPYLVNAAYQKEETP